MGLLINCLSSFQIAASNLDEYNRFKRNGQAAIPVPSNILEAPRQFFKEKEEEEHEEEEEEPKLER